MATVKFKFTSENENLADFLIALALDEQTRTDFQNNPKALVKSFNLGDEAAGVLNALAARRVSSNKAMASLRRILAFNNQIMDPSPVKKAKPAAGRKAPAKKR